jgi:serine protease Do
MLGVNIQNVTEETAKALDLNNVTGVIVSNVRPGSAAEKAGIKRGDIITAINGERIEDSNVLRNKVAGTPPGTEIRLSILRDGSAQEMTATLEESDTGEARPGTPGSERQNAPSGESQNRRLGLSLQPITAEIARQFGLTAGEGLAVTEVEPGGAAASAGILPGDIVMEVNRRAVNSIESVQSALEGAGSRPVLLLINRRGQTIYVAVPLQ